MQNSNVNSGEDDRFPKLDKRGEHANAFADQLSASGFDAQVSLSMKQIFHPPQNYIQRVGGYVSTDVLVGRFSKWSRMCVTSTRSISSA